MSDWAGIDAVASFTVPKDDTCRTIAIAHSQVTAKCAEAPEIYGSECAASMMIERAGHVEHGYKFNVVVRGWLRDRMCPDLLASWKELLKFLQRTFGCEIKEEHVCVTGSVGIWLRSINRTDSDKTNKRRKRKCW